MTAIVELLNNQYRLIDSIEGILDDAPLIGTFVLGVAPSLPGKKYGSPATFAHGCQGSSRINKDIICFVNAFNERDKTFDVAKYPVIAMGIESTIDASPDALVILGVKGINFPDEELFVEETIEKVNQFLYDEGCDAEVAWVFGQLKEKLIEFKKL